MKKYLIAAALTLSAFAASAGAFLPACNTVNDVQSDAVACFNAVGNDNGYVGSFLAQVALADQFNLPEVTGPLGSNPWTKVQSFGSDNNGVGTLTFAAPVQGWFAVTLKAGRGYNAYLFDGLTAGISSIDYSISKDLSHANVWTFEQSNFGSPPPIPEPTTYALMLAGLVAVGFVSVRRKTA
jgi:hypothetical protein